METNERESNPLKPQPTGGLKLMTIFIAVLVLHVLVISGFALKSWLYPNNLDNDMALDKTHKGTKIVDSPLGDLPASSDTASTDKSTTSAPATPDSSTEGPAATDTPAPATASAAQVASPAPTTPAPASAATVTPTPPAMAEDASSTAANPPTSKTPSGPIHNGPVITPPEGLAPPADNTAATVGPDALTPVADGTPYIVKRGDSLAKIAHRHHVALAKLRTANSLASDALHIGQKLVIPNRAQKPDAVATTAAPAGTTTAAPITDADPADASAAAPAPALASNALPKHTHHAAAVHHLYTVVKGDTLTKIAKRYHTTTSALVSANSLANAGRLSIGQKLHIPSHESRAATASQEAAPAEVEPHPAAKGQLANYVQ